MAELLDTATHVTGLKGRIQEATTAPTMSGVDSIAAGEMFYETDVDAIQIYDGTSWQGIVLT